MQPEEHSKIQITEGQQKSLHLPKAPIRIAIGDPEVADASLTSTPQDLLITGKKAGTTNLLIWNKSQSKPTDYQIRIIPKIIEDEFESLVEHAVNVPGKENEPNPSDASAVNLGGTQIQADIKIVEISRTALKEAGFFFGKNTPNSTIAVSPPRALKGVDGGELGNFILQSASGFFPYAQAFQMVFGNSSQGWLSSISLLEQGGYAYTLAEPSLTVMSGQTANFLAGGEFPIPVPQGGASTGAITIKFREFGVRLMLTPTLLDASRIVMKVSPEVSELDFTAGITSGGTQVPALKVRRTDTSIELGDGESFVISGLISQTTIANEDKLPGLGDLPYIGAFFRSKRFEKNNKELIMVVTPHIVHPLKRDETLPPLPGENYRRTDPDFSKFLFYPQEPNNRRVTDMEGFSR
ncbi:MAG: type II and III secretion system protein family protein [Gammaproteobacteria bacterium]